MRVSCLSLCVSECARLCECVAVGAAILPSSLEVLISNADIAQYGGAGTCQADGGVFTEPSRVSPGPAAPNPLVGRQNWFHPSPARPGPGERLRVGRAEVQAQQPSPSRPAAQTRPAPPPRRALRPSPRAPPRPRPAARSFPEEASRTQALVRRRRLRPRKGVRVCKQHCCQSSRVCKFQEPHGGFFGKRRAFASSLLAPHLFTSLLISEFCNLFHLRSEFFSSLLWMIFYALGILHFSHAGTAEIMWSGGGLHQFL